MRLANFNIILIVFATLTLCGCRSFFVAQSGSERIDTSGLATVDSSVLEMVLPYKQELEASMNIVLAELNSDLIKEQPESNLGNHIAQITLEAAELSAEREVDFAIMNYGGLRVPSVNKGPVMVRDAYQIMPFDNFIVIMDLEGSVIQKLLDQIAGYGGWPVHDIRFVIDNGKASAIEIGGEPIQESKIYTMAITDYLADGGDNLAILKSHTYYNTGVFLRDAIIDSWKATTIEGLKVEIVKDGRVTIK